MKAYTDLEQSKKLAEILPLESADMTLPFRHTLKDEYIPSPAISRNYIEVYNKMIKLPGMDKEEVCKLIQPAWSLAALLSAADFNTVNLYYNDTRMDWVASATILDSVKQYPIYKSARALNPIDACYEMIIKLYELNLL